MNQSILNAINITLDSYCFVISLIIFASLFKVKGGGLRTSKFFLAAILSDMVVSVSDVFTLLCEGPAKAWYFIGLPVSTFIYYAGNFTLLISFVLFICYLLGVELNNSKTNRYLFGLYGIYIIALLITPFTGFLYKIDAQNHYSRGDYFWVAVALEFTIYFLFIVMVFINGKKYGKKIVMLFFAFALVPQLLQIIQLAFYGISLVNTGWTISCLFMFIAINGKLEDEIAVKTREVENKNKRLIRLQDHTIVSLSNLVENRDSDTGEHVRRTSEYVELLARQCAKDGYDRDTLSPHYIDILKKAAPMHDIGKIVVPDNVLKKVGRLDEEEFAQMKRHALEGGRIVLEVFDDADEREYIGATMEIATSHHEKWDGTGYPKGLKGDEIPLSARIMAVADVFDALVSPRVYKKSMSYDEAFRIIEEGAGTHFDPILVQEFLKVRDKVIEINEKYKILEEQVTSIAELESEELEAI